VQRLETLIGALRQCCETVPDKRHADNAVYPMADIAPAAFSAFFNQCPSFLAHQRQLENGHGRSNCQTLFGLNRIPTDNHIRAMLDPVDPALLRPVFAAVPDQLENSGGIDAFRRPDGHVLIALDGTEYFCPTKSTAHSARSANAATARPRSSTPCRVPPWSLPATTMSCRCHPSSSPRKMAPRSRTARLVFSTWTELVQTLAFARPPPQPP
jgi:hypothetical protein